MLCGTYVIISGLLKTSENESGTTEEFETDSEEALHIPLSNETECLVGTSKSKLASGIFPMDAAQSDGLSDNMDLD